MLKLGMERKSGSNQDEEDYSKCPNVSSLSVIWLLVALCQVRVHVRRCPTNCFQFFVRMTFSGEPKIDQFNHSSATNQDIFKLQISVHHINRVQICYSFNYLCEDRSHLVFSNSRDLLFTAIFNHMK